MARSGLHASLAWAVVYAAVVYSSAAGYVAAYGNLAERRALQDSIGGNAGIAALFGRPGTLTTIGGFTAWRSLGVLVIVGSVWGAFLGARQFRGEEETGRWDVVLAGPTTRRRATAAAAL